VNAYEEKRESRIERMRARAAKLKTLADAKYHQYDALLNVMNGTPLLPGHHSYRRHKRDLERIDRATRKSFELSKLADDLERRANSAEINPSISSDDPDAVAKLREKLAGLEKYQATMKAANAAIRKGDDVALFALVGDQVGAELKKPDFCGRIGFANYQLSNNNAEIRRCKLRIAQLESRATAPAKEPWNCATAQGVVVVDEAENRVRIRFPFKPSAEVRTSLKQSGFRWAPSEGVWQRMPSPWAWHEAQRIVGGIAS
jgi:hypothetical protein